MEALKEFLRDYHYLVVGTLTALVTGYVMRKVYQISDNAPAQVDGENNEVFSHQGKMSAFCWDWASCACSLQRCLPMRLFIRANIFPRLH